MAKMYAWSNFPLEANEWGQVISSIKAGEEVSKSQLNVSDEEWDEYVASGAIREEKYPDIPADVSPAEYQKQLDNAAVNLDEAQALIDQATEVGVTESTSAAAEAEASKSSTASSSSGKSS